ncbi:hypothetical protein HQN86_19260 [Pedobacter panaciterrae]|uniref:hypothetical protein n=1 Tax=Pedobacter panaciterrae TaxID=363849 RepID=UPI00155DD8C4|nr:hypothetical protein [Pedobacter panaciterrae]NQX55769.1 hypothetical protein [Pedobacter panaciterrae]
MTCFFIINTAMAQSKQTDTLNKFTGTWSGVATKRLNENEIYRPYSITWRIHHIDNSKNQIELTEIGQRFESYEEIKKPKKATYKGHIDKDTLSIEISNPKTKNKYLVKLSLNKNEEHSMLIGKVEPIGTNDSLMFLLTKNGDDTSKYVKPKDEVEVVVLPPPPSKH